MKDVGDTWGDFTIIDKFKDKNKYKLRMKCQCGKEVIKRTDYLNDSRAKEHCGCKDSRKKDILVVGRKFGRLTILFSPTFSKNTLWVKCVCECGKEVEVRGYGIINGETQSCGCYNLEILKGRTGENHPMYKDGLSQSSEYKIWFNRIRHDCEDEWLDKDVFLLWAREKDIKKHICKHDYRLPYSPENCYFTNDESLIKGDIEQKRKKTSIDNFGVESYTQTEDFEERRKQTNLEKLGVEYPIQNKEIKEQIHNTNLEKYGSISPLGNDEIRDKISKTNLEKFGTEIASQSDQIKEKIIQKGIEDGRFHYIEGKTTTEIAKEKGTAKSTVVKWIKNYGLETALKMNKNKSGLETVIEQFLIKNNIKYKDQFYLDKKYADFLLTDYNILIEANGCRWHSDEIIENKNHHKERREKFLELGYETLFFNEDEINQKFEIVKSMILNKIGKSQRIFARKCELVKLNHKEAKSFFLSNHLMGAGCGTCLALKYKDQIVCAIRYTNKKECKDISRFCNLLNTNVVGGLSRLLSKIEGTVQSFVDLRYGNGKSLEKLNFKLKNCDISFKWTYGGKTYHRMKFKGNSGYENKMYKIWDCGQALYIR